MPLPSWPANVPYQVMEGWQMPQMFLPPLSTDMEGGNQRLRSKPGSNVAVVEYPLRPMTTTEYSNFDTFVRTTLGNGASRFTMSVYTGAGYVSKTVQLEQGKSPQVSASGPYRLVTLSLRIFGM